MNFAGAEAWDDVAAGVLGFGVTGLGRRVANACLRDLKTNFRGDVWGNNGPGVITRTLQKLCATKYVRRFLIFHSCVSVIAIYSQFKVIQRSKMSLFRASS